MTGVLCTRRSPYIDVEAAYATPDPPVDPTGAAGGSLAGRPSARDITLVYRGGNPGKAQSPQSASDSASSRTIKPVPASALEAASKPALPRATPPSLPVGEPSGGSELPARLQPPPKGTQQRSAAPPDAPVGSPLSFGSIKKAASPTGVVQTRGLPPSTGSVDRLKVSENLSKRVEASAKTATEAKFVSFAATKDPPPKATPAAAKAPPAAAAKNEPQLALAEAVPAADAAAAPAAAPDQASAVPRNNTVLTIWSRVMGSILAQPCP
jgi:hypothetical protein